MAVESNPPDTDLRRKSYRDYTPALAVTGCTWYITYPPKMMYSLNIVSSPPKVKLVIITSSLEDHPMK